MKKAQCVSTVAVFIITILIAAIILVSCGGSGGSNTSSSSGIAVALALNSDMTALGATEVVLLEKTFTRGTGAPITETVMFPAVAGPAIIKLILKSVSSSVISVNGSLVFDSSNFNRNVKNLSKEITLNGSANMLTVLLKSKPGGTITIRIVQYIQADGAAFIGPNGGVVEVTNQNSPIYGAKIDIPPNTSKQDTLFTISHKDDLVPPNSYEDVSHGIKISCNTELNGYVAVTIPLFTSLSDNDLLIVAHYNDKKDAWDTLPIKKIDYQKNMVSLLMIDFSIIKIQRFGKMSNIPSQKKTSFAVDKDSLNYNNYPAPPACYGMANFSLWYFLNNYSPDLNCRWSRDLAKEVSHEAHDVVFNVWIKVLGGLKYLFNNWSLIFGQVGIRDALLYRLAIEGKPDVLVMNSALFTEADGHAVVVTGYKLVSSDKIEFYIYDVNYPGESKTIYCKKYLGKWFFEYTEQPQYIVFDLLYRGDTYGTQFKNILDDPNHPVNGACNSVPTLSISVDWPITTISCSGFTPNESIKIAMIWNGGPGLPYDPIPADQNGDGSASYFFPIPGFYQISAWQASGKFASTTYTLSVSFAVLVQPKIGSRSAETVLDEGGYGFTPNSTVTLHFNAPDGNHYVISNKLTNDSGSFSHSYTCNSGTAIGQWAYYAIDDATGNVSNTVYFNITP